MDIGWGYYTICIQEVAGSNPTGSTNKGNIITLN